MGNATSVQTQFSGGEISAFAQGRFDLPTYKASLATCLNGWPIETGAWTRRPGTQFAGATVRGYTGRVIKFDFAASTPYTCEFVPTAVSFRVGKKLVTTNDDKAVLAVSAATPAVVQTSGAHGWSTGNIVFLHDLAAGVPVLQNRQFLITVVDATHFSLADALTGASINGAALGTPFISGKVSRRLIITTPYLTMADLQLLRLVQTDGSPSVAAAGATVITDALPFAVLLCPGYAPQFLLVNAAPTATTFATFSVSAIANGNGFGQWQDGPYLDPSRLNLIQGTFLTASAASGTVSLAPGGGGGPPVLFNAGMVGQAVRLFSQPLQYDPAHTYNQSDVVTLYSNLGTTDPSSASYWTSLGGSNTNNIPSGNPTKWGVAQAPAAIWTWGVITSYGLDGANTVRMAIYGPPLVVSGASAPIYLFRFGVYGGANGWPTCGTYHEGRLWLAGTIPNRIDGSKSNDLFVFSPTETDGAVTDADAPSYVFNAPDSNPIFWIEPDLQGLIAGTLGGEWLVQATAANAPLTATSVQAHRVTKVGCANIEPTRCDLTLAFVQKHQRKVMEYFADVFSGKLVAPNLSENAMHMTTNAVQEIRYQHSVNPIVWMRDGANDLFGATYRRTTLFSSQKPDFIGWHRHKLGGADASRRNAISMTVGPSVDGTLDTLTLVTINDSTAVCNVELLTDQFDEDDTLLDAVYLDMATQPTSFVINAPDGTNPNGSITFNGLWHQNNTGVTVWASGLDCGDYAVANGSITVPFGDSIAQGPGGGYFIQSVWNGNPIAWIGYTYASQGQGLPPVDPREAGTQVGMASAKMQRIQQFGVKVVGAGHTVHFGGSFSTTHTARFPTAGGSGVLTQDHLFSGVYWDTLDDTDSIQGSALCWQIDRPYPFTLTASTVFLHTQDR